MIKSLAGMEMTLFSQALEAILFTLVMAKTLFTVPLIAQIQYTVEMGMIPFSHNPLMMNISTQSTAKQVTII